jgi:hypothetical protein
VEKIAGIVGDVDVRATVAVVIAEGYAETLAGRIGVRLLQMSVNVPFPLFQYADPPRHRTSSGGSTSIAGFASQ